MERTEEVQDIIQRMPSTFGKWVSGIVASLFVMILILGWVVRYPDIITGQVTINANKSPIKLISNTSGKLRLLTKSHQRIKEGDYVAYLENSAEIKDMKNIIMLGRQFNINESNYIDALSRFPKNISLGEFNVKYFNFMQALQELANHQKENLFTKQKELCQRIFLKQKEALQTARQKLVLNKENLALANKFYNRDLTLSGQKVLSNADLDKSEMNYLSAKDGHQSILRDLVQHEQQIQETENKLQQIDIQEHDKQKEMLLALASTYTDLMDQLEAWERQYIFKAPFDGQVQFLKFWTNSQFVQQGEPIFTIVPQNSSMLGQVNLPAFGAGKVKIGQEAIIKLDNYPYAEYGSIKGKVRNISLTTNATTTPQGGSVESYLIELDLPNQLKTNYGAQLHAKFEIKGLAEIITNDRRLIQRLFDNLKYAVEVK